MGRERWSVRAVAAGVALGAAAALAAGQGSGPPLTPADATQKVGETHAVEFVVKSNGPKTKDGRLYLNSHQNPTWEGNFAAVVEAADANRFPGGAKGLEKFYLGKQVRVTGRIETFRNGAGVRATGPDKLVVTNAKPERDPLEVPPPPDPVPDDFDPRPPSYLPYYLIAGGLVLFGVWYALSQRKRRREAAEDRGA